MLIGRLPNSRFKLLHIFRIVITVLMATIIMLVFVKSLLQHLAFAAVRYAGKQRLTACYDQRELTRKDVRELLEELAREAIPVPD